MQKDDETGRFFDGVEPSEGVFRSRGFFHGIRQRRGHAGFEKPGEDAIGPDIPFSEFEGIAFGQSDKSGFRRGVGGLAMGRSDS